MHHQRDDTAGGQRPRTVQRSRRIAHAEPHLGGERYFLRDHAAHRRDDAQQLFGIGEQHRAAAVAIDRRRRTTEVEIDPRRGELDQLRRILGQAPGIAAEKLHHQRRSGTRSAAVVKLGAKPPEGARRQQIAGDPDELADGQVIATDARQHVAQDVVDQALPSVPAAVFPSSLRLQIVRPSDPQIFKRCTSGAVPAARRGRTSSKGHAAFRRRLAVLAAVNRRCAGAETSAPAVGRALAPPRPKASASARTTPASRIRNVCWTRPPPMSTWSTRSAARR
jgi:hypothetical protein